LTTPIQLDYNYYAVRGKCWDKTLTATYLLFANNMKEIWKDIEGLEGYYQISNLARLKSLARKVFYKNVCYIKKEKILKCPIDHYGYGHFGFSKHGERIEKRRARLLAQAFIPNPENKPYINHINAIRHDDRIENIEWCTQKENIQHAKRMGLLRPKRGEENGRSKLNEKQVRVIKWLKIINPKLSNKKISQIFGMKEGAICSIYSRTNWKHVTI